MTHILFKRILLLAFLVSIGSFCFSQETGFLIFSGKTKFSNTAKKKIDISPETNIKVTKLDNEEILEELKSDTKGKFEIKLNFGTDYKITFSQKGAATAYIVVYASQVPKEMYDILPPGYETDLVMMAENDAGVNKYKCAFSKVLFDKKRKGFIEDLNHRNMFTNGTVMCDEMMPQKNKPVVVGINEPKKEEKKEAVGGKFLAGENPSVPLVNTTVLLVNEKGEVIESTSTNLLGAFVFTRFVFEKENLMRVTVSDAAISGNKKIFFIGKDGKEVQQTTANDKGAFEFRLLKGDKNTFELIKIEDSKLKRDIIGKLMADDKPSANSKLDLKNDAGVLIQSATTDTEGKFVFSDVNTQQIIVIAINPSSNIKAGSKVAITDEEGKVQKQLTYKPGENFEFKMLPHEQKELSRYYAEDPWLKVVNLKPNQQSSDITITENVYFNAGEFTLLPEAQKVLDKVIAIMQQVPSIKMELGAHTDSKGSDPANMELSKKRAEAAMAYMISKKIDAKRLKAVGYGETRLVNKCSNNIECTEEEHAQNRRIEFKVIK